MKIAAFQYEITGGLNPRQWEDKLASKLSEARGKGADLALLPELACCDLLQPCKTAAEEKEQWDRIAREFTPIFFEKLPELAKKTGVSVLPGTLPRLLPNGEIRNTAPLAILDGGRTKIVFQDKNFPTSTEARDWKWTGGDELRTFETPWGKTAILICYDAEVPGLSNSLVQSQPELLLVPSCTETVLGFHRVRWTAQARAVEHYAYVVHTSTVGKGTATPNMSGHYGQAALLAPSDKPFVGVETQGPHNQPACLVVELDLEKLRHARTTATIYPARDQLKRRPT